MLKAKNKVVRNVVGADKTVVDLFKSKKLKNNKSKILIYINIRATKKPTFLIPNTKKAFTQLGQAFIKAPIFALGYTISKILS